MTDTGERRAEPATNATDACRALAYTPRGEHLRCRLLSEHASDMVSVHAIDEEFTYLYVSPAVKRLFGYDAEELEQHSAFAFIHPDDCAAVEESAAHMRELGETVSLTYRFRTKAGPYTWVESTCRFVPDSTTGEPMEVIATTRSAEVRVAAELERARLLRDADVARAAAESANHTKDQFLAMMSHEFRTPLNAIAGHVEILQLGIHGPINEKQRHALDRIDRSQRYLLRLVNDILNVERLRTGRLEYDVKPVRISDLVQELEPMIGPQLTAKSLQLVVDLSERDVALADREKLEQVLINLISNAVKFTPEGGSITLDCPRRAEQTEPDERCFVRVRDTGVGIPDGKQAAIFEPFVQVDISPSRRAEGAGLGLAISRDLSRGMGGDLRVRSIEGVGASFTISLPRAPFARVEEPVTA
jgi:PAS domain S-box-containing protein